ncbi:hypothetical protein [Pseudoduganella violaceinigra]|uniref:hypothetical protein n=1 Tax=Pseudoduganella violaceinigra TaxID=246602 RepID=UPI0012B6202A|nr:hypothetical protein [Pseudoduganella violaceinigra]
MPLLPRPCLALTLFSLALSSIVVPSVAQACKDRTYPETFPAAELNRFEHVYVVHVERVIQDVTSADSRYAKPFIFDGKVLRAVKGSKKPGETILGATTSDEEALARCPISLKAGKTYLLMLNGSEPNYALPRYGSLYVSEDQVEFKKYLSDLTEKAQ